MQKKKTKLFCSIFWNVAFFQLRKKIIPTPSHQLPAFKHGNIILNESVAVCLYREVCHVQIVSYRSEGFEKDASS